MLTANTLQNRMIPGVYSHRLVPSRPYEKYVYYHTLLCDDQDMYVVVVDNVSFWYVWIMCHSAAVAPVCIFGFSVAAILRVESFKNMECEW